jgi:ATP synthase protein I
MQKQLDYLKEKIARMKRQNAQPASSKDPVESAALGTAFRLGVELCSGTILGFGIGLAIDRYFNISPFGLIVFSILGLCAGIMNVIKASKKM